MKSEMLRYLLFLFCALSLAGTSVLAQPVLTGLQDPTALVLEPDSGQTFIFERGLGRIVRVHDAQPVTVVDELLGDGPDRYTTVAGIVIRERNMLSVVGLAGEVLRLMTFELTDDKPAAVVPGLSGDFPVESSAGSIHNLLAVAATDFAVYLAVAGNQGQSALLRIPLGSKLGLTTKPGAMKPQVLFKQASSEPQPTAMTCSPQGHLVVSFAAPQTSATLRFHHAETGRILLALTTDLETIGALGYAASGWLYAAAEQNGRAGVYRLDAAFADTKQVVRATETALVPHVVAVDGRGSTALSVLAGGKVDGRLLLVDLGAAR